jgi:hypothetical protein
MTPGTIEIFRCTDAFCKLQPEQPFLIVREATRSEWIENVHQINPNYNNFDFWPYYYEVLTD